jgi:tetratricopeptide (TPR) repeat protein
MNAFPSPRVIYQLSGMLVIASFILGAKSTLSATADDRAPSLTGFVDKKQYALGEPVYLTVVLRNTTATSLTVAPDLSPQDGSIEIRIEDASGKGFNFVPTAVLDSDAPAASLLPNQARASVVPIFYGGRGWTFEKPGRYTIKTAYVFPSAGKSIRVLAAPTNLEVLPDEVGRLLVQNDKRSSHEAGKFLLWMGGDHLRGGTAVLEELLAKYPRAAVTNYAALALGRSWARHFTDYGAERVRLPDYRKAQQYFQKVKPAELPVNLRVQYNLTQALVNARLGNRPSALTHLNDAKKIISERQELSNLSEAANRLQKMLESGANP